MEFSEGVKYVQNIILFFFLNYESTGEGKIHRPYRQCSLKKINAFYLIFGPPCRQIPAGKRWGVSSAGTPVRILPGAHKVGGVETGNV